MYDKKKYIPNVIYKIHNIYYNNNIYKSISKKINKVQK